MTASLVIVGTGIRPSLQTTGEAVASIASAEKAYFLLNDPLSDAWIRRLNPNVVSLAEEYREGESRLIAYDRMVNRVFADLKAGLSVCLALYGHPGVFVRPSHELVRRCEEADIPATMLPGVSSEDSLFAELNVDPAEHGCQSYEANDLLVNRKRVEPRAALVLWQVGTIGHTIFREKLDVDTGKLRTLCDFLLESYPADQPVAIYEACEFPIGRSRIDWTSLENLPSAEVTPRTTLYLPPVAS